MLRFESHPDARTLQTRVTSTVPMGDVTHVTLEDTLFYPTGGGQPHDTGWIAEARVTDVFRHGHEIVHVVEGPLGAGPVTLRLDERRRLDHSQQHTAQHLLTALIARHHGIETTSWHLGESYTSIELETQEPLVLGEIEARANRAISSDIEVREAHVTRAEYEEMEVRSRGLPDGVEGLVRIVEIDGIDTSACGGTHVSSLGRLRGITLLRTQRVRGRMLLSFLAGERVLARLGASLERERALSGLLSSAPENHAELVEGLQRQLKEAESSKRRRLDELARLRAQALCVGGVERVLWHEPKEGMGFLNKVAGHLERIRPDVVAILTSGDEHGAGVFLVSGPASQVAHLGPKVAAALEGRGGGRPGRYQGKASNLGARQEIENFV